MSKPESRGPGRAPLSKARVNAFFHHLGRTGSVTVAANRAQLRRSTLYERRQDDEEFAERWARALDLGVERLQDNAMNRAGRAGGFDTSAIRVCVEKPFGTVRKTRHKGLARFGNLAKRRCLGEHLAQPNRDNSCPENRPSMVHVWGTARTPRTVPSGLRRRAETGR